MIILAELGRHLAAILLVVLPFAILDRLGVLDLADRSTALVVVCLSALATSGVSVWNGRRRAARE